MLYVDFELRSELNSLFIIFTESLSASKDLEAFIPAHPLIHSIRLLLTTLEFRAVAIERKMLTVQINRL